MDATEHVRRRACNDLCVDCCSLRSWSIGEPVAQTTEPPEEITMNSSQSLTYTITFFTVVFSFLFTHRISFTSQWTRPMEQCACEALVWSLVFFCVDQLNLYSDSTRFCYHAFSTPDLFSFLRLLTNVRCFVQYLPFFFSLLLLFLRSWTV